MQPGALRCLQELMRGEAAEHFAAELMDRWGVGDAWCNDGVVLAADTPASAGLSSGHYRQLLRVYMFVDLEEGDTCVIA